MPHLTAQFEAPDKFSNAIADREEALIMMFKDMAKIARGEIPAREIQRYARESLQAVTLIYGPN